MSQNIDLATTRLPVTAHASRFIDGIRVIPRAIGMIARDARLRKLAMRPFLVSVIVVLVGLPLVLWFAGDLFRLVLPSSAQWSGAIETLARVLFTIAITIAGLFVLLMLGRIVGAPFNSKLSEGVEEVYLGIKRDSATSLRAIVGEGIGSVATALGRLLLFLLFYPIIFATQLIPVAGVFIFPVLSTLYGAFALSFDFTESAWERHLPGFRNRLRFMREHLSAFLGFGLGAVVMMMVPFVNLLLIPVAVAAGTLLYLDISGTKEAFSEVI